MTTVRLYFQDDRVGPKFARGTFRQGERVREAIRLAAEDAADAMLDQGRANIASAGNFGQRWTEGLQAPITEGGGDIRISLTHAVPYFMVHQRGAVIKGKPMLWIPLSFARVPKGTWARDFPGGLFRVDRKGKAPLLLSRVTGEPKYFGKTSVRIPKRFRVIEIARKIAQNMRAFYQARLNKIGPGNG